MVIWACILCYNQYGAQVLTVTLPKEAVYEGALLTTNAYVNVVMMSDVVFRIHLADIKEKAPEPQPEAKDEWVNVDGRWQWIDNAWYYFALSGVMARNGWMKIDNTWYYFQSSGVMAKNQWVDGCWLNASGAWA